MRRVEKVANFQLEPLILAQVLTVKVVCVLIY